MMFRVGTATDIGRKRSQNQDNVASHPELGLFVVADGMGGHRGGETASLLATEIIPLNVKKEMEVAGAHWIPREVMTRAISRANDEIYLRSLNERQLQGMGTTAVALLFKDNLLTIGHVGDSRAYFYRDGSIWQLTRDHSLVQEKFRAGLITRAETKTDRMKNVITRSVGFESEVTVEIYEIETLPGDLFLICSDGLSGLVEEPELLKIMSRINQSSPDLQQSVDDLIQAANRNGGDDNISAILVGLSN